MTSLFMTVVNMSMKACVPIFFVFVGKAFLRVPRAQRRWAYLLWLVVALRLAVPVFPEVPDGVLILNWDRLWYDIIEQYRMETLADNYTGQVVVTYKGQPGYREAVAAGIIPEGAPDSRFVRTDPDGVSPPKTLGNTLFPILAYVWVGGAVLLLAWNGLSMLRLRRRLDTAIFLEDGVYVSDRIDNAFIVGLLRPVIYLPFGLSRTERAHILAHERTHIRHFDHWVKALSFLLLCVHWFNPLVWLAFSAAMHDMEATCDEDVFVDMDDEARADYAQTLLNLSQSRRRPIIAPLSFGESHLSARIKHIFAYRKGGELNPFAIAVIFSYTFATLLTEPVDRSDDWLEPAMYLPQQRIYATDTAPACDGFCLTIPVIDDTGRKDNHLYIDGVSYGVQADYFLYISESRIKSILPREVELPKYTDAAFFAGSESRACLLLKCGSKGWYAITGTGSSVDTMQVDGVMTIAPALTTEFYKTSLSTHLEQPVELLDLPILLPDKRSDRLWYAAVGFRSGDTLGVALFQTTDFAVAELTNTIQLFPEAASDVITGTTPITAGQDSYRAVFVTDPDTDRVTLAGKTYTRPDQCPTWFLLTPWPQEGEDSFLNRVDEFEAFAEACIGTPGLVLDTEKYPEGVLRVEYERHWNANHPDLNPGIVILFYLTDTGGVYYAQGDAPAAVGTELVPDKCPDGTWAWDGGTTQRVTDHWYTFALH